MDRQEAKKTIAVIMAAYPNYKPVDIPTTIDVWARMLKEYPYALVDAALEAYIATDAKGFPPSVGQVIDRIHSITEPEGMNEMEAWALVKKALRHCGYNAKEEYAKLPKAAQRAVGSAEQMWAWATDEEFNEGVISSNFMRNYRAAVQKEKELAKMPESVREIAKMVTDGMAGKIEKNKKN